MAHTDVLHVYGMSRASYIPQTTTFRLQNPVVIFELLQKAGARALVYESSIRVDLSGCAVPTHPAIQISQQDAADFALPSSRHGQTTLHRISYSSSTQADQQMVALSSSHAIVDGSTTLLREPSKRIKSV